MFFSAGSACLYAPSAGSVDDSAMDGAIALAQLQAEGPRGANRELEKKERTEHLRVTSQKLSTARLKFTPIDLTQPISIRIRGGNTVNALSRAVPLGTWRTLDAEDYELRKEGHLSLNLGSNSSYFGFSSYGGGYGSRVNRGRTITEIEATYTGGFDFSGQDDPAIEALKYALGAIVSYQASDIGRGVVETDVDDQLRERYSTSAATPGDATRIPDSLLLPFIKYRPIGV